MSQPVKRSITLSVRGDLVAEAERLGINLSAIFETTLQTAVKAARIEKWRHENWEAFAAYDRRIEANGVFSAGKRVF